MLHLYPAMTGVGLLAGFMSGMFGIGGGIIVTPLLVIAYPFLAGDKLPIEVVTGLSSAQGFFSSAISFLMHKNKNKPDWSIFKWFAIPMAIANFSAALVAQCFSEQIIMLIFGMLGLISLSITLLCRRPLRLFIEHRNLCYPLVGVSLGVLCGLVGQGGGFIYLPVLATLFGLPIKQAVSTSAAIGIIGASGALFGRLHGDLTFLHYTIELIAGILIGSYLGAALSRRLSPAHLRNAMNVFIFLCSIQMIMRAFG